MMHRDDEVDDLSLERRIDSAMIESTFLELDHQPATTDPPSRRSRLSMICAVWPHLSLPYEYVQLAHFLEGDPSTVAQELYDAALRTAWRLHTPTSDPWDDAWWFEAVEAIPDAQRQEALRSFSTRAVAESNGDAR